MTLHTQLPITSWFRIPQAQLGNQDLFNTGLDGAIPGLSGIFYLQGKWHHPSSVLCQIPWCGGGHHSPRPLGYLGSPLGLNEWIAMGVFILYRWNCHHHMGWSSGECGCFPSQAGCPPIMDGTQGSAQLAKIQAGILAQYTLVSKWFHRTFLQTPGSLPKLYLSEQRTLGS